MANKLGFGASASIGDLVSRLIEQGKAYAKAEVAVARETALAYVRASYRGVALGIVAFILVLAALPVLIAAFGMALAIWLGTAGGLAAAGVVTLLVAGLLGWLAARSFGAVGGKVR